MARKSSLNITELNFDSIKSNLKTFLQSQEEFTDYDFESSTLSILLDLLAYNTYYNSFYTNMVGNEMFLDSAQLRNSVVSRAKMLGYVPRSARGATASLDVNIIPGSPVSSVTVAKNTRFTTEIDGTSYTFVTPQSYDIPESATLGTYSATISITEGEPLTQRFTVSTANPVRYILPNENVDTSSITIQIQESVSNTSVSTYTLQGDLSQVNSISKIFYVQENEDSKFEVYFGDDTFGKKPIDGNIVIVDYRVCSGDLTNGAATFTDPGTLGGYSNFTTTLNTAAQGGGSIESINSVKRNAPYWYQQQDRLVTINDYKTAILSENADIQSVEVWGGEDNDPPIYGKVYVSAKPTSGAIISNERKESIKSSLKSRNVVAIDVEFTDATYMYIVPTISVRYNPELTSLSANELNVKIQTAVQSFETNNLGTFGNKFYLSTLINNINTADDSFVSTDIDFQLEKRFLPVTNQNQKYLVNFNTPIKEPVTTQHSSHAGSHNLFSSKFEWSQYTSAYFDEDGEGVLRIFQQRPTSTVYVKNNAGTVDYNNGLVTIENVNVKSYDGNYLSIKINPVNKNIFGVRNQILLISGTTVTTIDDLSGKTTSSVGTVITNGSLTTNLTDNATSTIVV
jgi:hypothetical protein